MFFPFFSRSDVILTIESIRLVCMPFCVLFCWNADSSTASSKHTKFSEIFIHSFGVFWKENSRAHTKTKFNLNAKLNAKAAETLNEIHRCFSVNNDKQTQVVQIDFISLPSWFCIKDNTKFMIHFISKNAGCQMQAVVSNHFGTMQLYQAIQIQSTFSCTIHSRQKRSMSKSLVVRSLVYYCISEGRRINCQKLNSIERKT